MTKERAAAKVAELVSQAESAIAEAEELAGLHGLQFEFSPAYGMGGTFYGEDPGYLQRSYYKEAPCWVASSETC